MPKKADPKKKVEEKKEEAGSNVDAILRDIYMQNKTRIKVGRLQDDNAVLDDTAKVWVPCCFAVLLRCCTIMLLS